MAPLFIAGTLQQLEQMDRQQRFVLVANERMHPYLAHTSVDVVLKQRHVTLRDCRQTDLRHPRPVHLQRGMVIA